MTTYIALLRAVNVGGHQPVPMADLRSLVARLGFDSPLSLLQSGNLVFRGRPQPADELERILEVGASQHLGLDTAFFVRTAAEWREVIAGNPFRREAQSDPAHLLVMVLKAAPGTSAVRMLEAAIAGPERVKVAGRHAYLVYPVGIGRSRLTTPLIEAKLDTRGTGRNWNTVLKLAALVE
jgi:uncharacterized protein (DUF1697 family)